MISRISWTSSFRAGVERRGETRERLIPQRPCTRYRASRDPAKRASSDTLQRAVYEIQESVELHISPTDLSTTKNANVNCPHLRVAYVGRECFSLRMCTHCVLTWKCLFLALQTTRIAELHSSRYRAPTTTCRLFNHVSHPMETLASTQISTHWVDNIDAPQLSIRPEILVPKA